MKNEDSPLMMIYTENGDQISPNSTQKNGDATDNETEEPAVKKMHLDDSVSNGISASEIKLDNSSRIFSHQLAEKVQDSPILNEFMDPVLLERLKGTIRLRLQGSLSQAVKGLLNATQNSIEEGNRLKKVNNDLQRRIKKVEKITQKVQELVSERIPPTASTSQSQYYVVEASTNGALISSHPEGAPSNGEVLQSTFDDTQMHIVVETAPLPEIDRSNIVYESALPPMQPPLRISFHVSSEEGTQLAFEIDQTDYAYEPAESYELYSYASADVDPQIGLTSALWQRVGAIEAIPLPIMCKLDYLQPGNIYHFAAFSIDKYKRVSEWSNVVTLPVGFPS